MDIDIYTFSSAAIVMYALKVVLISWEMIFRRKNVRPNFAKNAYLVSDIVKLRQLIIGRRFGVIPYYRVCFIKTAKVLDFEMFPINNRSFNRLRTIVSANLT